MARPVRRKRKLRVNFVGAKVLLVLGNSAGRPRYRDLAPVFADKPSQKAGLVLALADLKRLGLIEGGWIDRSQGLALTPVGRALVPRVSSLADVCARCLGCGILADGSPLWRWALKDFPGAPRSWRGLTLGACDVCLGRGELSAPVVSTPNLPEVAEPDEPDELSAEPSMPGAIRRLKPGSFAPFAVVLRRAQEGSPAPRRPPPSPSKRRPR